MFEKEAEEYLKKDGTKAEQILSIMQGKIKVTIKQIPFILAAFQQTFIDGAEFGYNKGYHEAEEHYLNVIDSQHKLVDESKKKDFRKCMKCTNGTYQSGFKDGYNKAKEEMIQNGLALQSDMDKTIEQNIALKKELNKAKEWNFTHRNKEHLVIDCPKGEENKLYLLLLNSRDSKEFEFGRKVPVVCYWDEEWSRFERLEHTIGERNVNRNDINAWKEIVLPELPNETKEKNDSNSRM